MARSYRLGDSWFVVSCGWWQRVMERGVSTDARVTNVDIVDASRSCRCCNRSVLQPGLMEDVDYRIVSERAWNAVALEFGYDWVVRREVVNMGRRLAVDVYPAALEEPATGHNHLPNSGIPADGDSPPTSPERSEELTPEALELWRADLKLGQLVDALDTDSKWYEARVVDVTDARVKVHYRGWSTKWDEWLARTSVRLMPLHSKVRDWRRFRVNDEVQVGETRPGKKRMLWRDARVLSTAKSLLVQLQIDDEVHWMDAQDERLCPPGTHRAANANIAGMDVASLSSPTSVTTVGSSASSPPVAVRRKRLKTSSSQFSQFDE